MHIHKLTCMPQCQRIFTVLFIILSSGSNLRSQEVFEYSQPVEKEFPDGYEIYDASGKLLKTETGPTRAKVQAYFEQEGRLLYISDWSYERLKNQGITPNVILEREAVRPALENGQDPRTSKSAELARTVAQMETAIANRDLDQAFALAGRIKAIAANSGPLEKAVAFYYSAVANFLTGTRDREAEVALKNALDLYMSENDVEGVWRSLCLLQRLGWDAKGNRVDLRTTAEAAENQLIRFRLGLAPDSDPAEIFVKLSQGEPLASLKKKLNDLFARLSMHPVHGAKIRSDHEIWERNLIQRFSSFGLHHYSRLPRIQYYIEEREKFGGVTTQLSQYAEGEVRSRLELLTEIESSIAHSSNQNGSASVVEGFNYSGGRWAYEFIVQPTEPTLDLASDSTGVIVFADSECVVRAVRLPGSWADGSSHEKTELSFYDAKTCKLVSIVSVPNRVFAVGKLGESAQRRFYIGTITPAKYRYDDCPLAITLTDLSSRSIERIPLVAEDYWFALGHGVEIGTTSESGSESIRLMVERGTSSQYEKVQPQRKAFVQTRIFITEGLKVSAEGERWADRISAEELHRRLAAQHEPGLGHLGVRPYRSDTALNSEKLAFGSTDEGDPGLVLARASENGKLTRFDLGRLKRSIAMLSPAGVSNPSVLPNGALACVSNGELHLIDQKAKQVVKFPGNEKPLLVVSSKNREARWRWGARQLDLLAGTFRYSEAGRFWRFDVHGDAKFEAIVADARVVSTLGRGGRILDWDAATETFVVLNGTYQRISDSTGEPFGIGWDGGGKQVYNGISYSNTLNGWRAQSFVTGASTGGISSCVALEKAADGSKMIHVADGLPFNADPLALVEAGPNVRVIFGSGDKVQLVEVNPTTGAKESIKIWNYASRFGNALFDHSSKIILIPGAAGFEAWTLPGNGEPRKSFDLILADDDSYAVVLPNGLYAGSPGCEKLLRFGTIEGSSLSAWRNRPAEVLKALGGNSSQVEILERVTERWLLKLENPQRLPEPAAEDFPTLTLDREIPLWVDSTDVTLGFEAKAGASPLRQLVVRVNGVEIQGGANEGAGEGSLSRKVRLAEGQNWLEAVAIDDRGRTSNRVRFRTILRRAEKPTKRFVIAMGISIYRNPDFNLGLAAKDATDFLNAAKNSFPGSSEVLLLRNDEVSRDAPDQIRSFLSSASENDEVVAFGAGHGMLDHNLDYFFCNHEFDPENPTGTAIRFDDLVDALNSTKALKRLLLLDTCHSGTVGEKDELLLAQMNSGLPSGVRVVRTSAPVAPMPGGLGAAAQQRFIEEMFLLPGLHRGLTIIGASAGAQFAFESPEWNNGVFTASILEGLLEEKADSDGDGRVTVSELRDYSGTRVEELTQGAQSPSVVSFESDQDFDLLRRSSAASPETIIRNFYQAMELRDEDEVAKFLAEKVDYFTSGNISKNAVMADIKGDWKRYIEANYKISNFAKTGPSSFRFVLDYDLLEGDRPDYGRPRSGKLQMEAKLSDGGDAKISNLRAKVISAY